jgi:hypothetical protein
MALRGSLSEFELAEILQLIARDSKTGQLVLSHDDKEGFIIFHQGSVVAAGNDASNLQKMLFDYLISIKLYSEEELNELLYLCQGEMRLFSQELVNRQYLSGDELIAVTRSAIEDLACSLFLWTEGHYRFDSIDRMDEYIIGGIVFPADAITMEAMRRSDEWKRIQKYIGSETVFSPTPKIPAEPRPSVPPSPLTDPVGYVFSLVDGVSNVSQLCSKSFFFEYRVYEILFGLWQNSRIVPMTVKRTPPKTPLKKERLVASELATYAATVVAMVVAILLLFSASYLYNTFILRPPRAEGKYEIHEPATPQSIQKVRIALLYYRALEGKPPGTLNQLILSGMVSRLDVAGEQINPLSCFTSK